MGTKFRVYVGRNDDIISPQVKVTLKSNHALSEKGAFLGVKTFLWSLLSRERIGVTKLMFHI